MTSDWSQEQLKISESKIFVRVVWSVMMRAILWCVFEFQVVLGRQGSLQNAGRKIEVP